MLTDKHHRFHNYLRISLTDRCNFRCTYCMPLLKYAFMPSAKLMTPTEIEEIAKVFVDMGVDKIKLTGGEPLIRQDFTDILERLAKLPVNLSLTTNGSLIHHYIKPLKSAGIRTVNVSLDSLDAETFTTIAQKDQFKRVWENILNLLHHGFRVKINVVAIKGVIEKELAQFVEITRHLPLHVRFIEFMPFTHNKWDTTKVVTANEMLGHVAEEFDIIKLNDEPNSTAKKYKVIGHEGTFAFITTMSSHFCGTCNRLRLTAEGKLKNCLFGKDEIDILGPFRNGAPIHSLIETSVRKKHPFMGGQFTNDYEQTNPTTIINRSMIAIGG